MAWRLIRGAF